MDAYGETDDHGHLWYELPEPVGNVTKLYRQKRVTQTMNEDTAESILTDMEPTEDGKSVGAMTMWDECTRQVTVIDEDAVLALAYKKEITEKQLAEMYDESVTYALYLK